MSTHSLDNQMPERPINEIAELKRQIRELRTLQTQGENAIQIGYTDDAVFEWPDFAPNTGLIGTFVFALQYDNPVDDSVVFADLDIAVNKGTDTFGPTNTLDPYTGALEVEVINSQYFVESWYTSESYYPAVKVVRLYTTASAVADDFFIHYRWRYVGVGKTLVPVTGTVSILP